MASGVDGGASASLVREVLSDRSQQRAVPTPELMHPDNFSMTWRHC